jgi:adenine-specific DNA-methyltransferase
MKYMGSKRVMLSNGLGEVLRSQLIGAKRFADLFAGSSAVAWFAAENSECRVLASDLQSFAVALAEAVITRDEALDSERIWPSWKENAKVWLSENELYSKANLFDGEKWGKARRRNVEDAREISQESRAPITRSYGGHYFSPKQALILDSLRLKLPTDARERKVALAALICAASQCAASPGHTAQPFQPTANAAEFLFNAWRRDVWKHVETALKNICPKHARLSGKGVVSDAQTLAEQLGSEDLAFIDPPYSGVHYSRFYHVLETVARGTCDPVEGVGRYPAPSERPKSDFSIQSKSNAALDKLFATLAERKVRTVVTFPKEKTSNGLSGAIVKATAGKYFEVSTKIVNGRFSTLGGNLHNRKARIPAYEVILTLSPRRVK